MASPRKERSPNEDEVNDIEEIDVWDSTETRVQKKALKNKDQKENGITETFLRVMGFAIPEERFIALTWSCKANSGKTWKERFEVAETQEFDIVLGETACGKIAEADKGWLIFFGMAEKKKKEEEEKRNKEKQEALDRQRREQKAEREEMLKKMQRQEQKAE